MFEDYYMPEFDADYFNSPAFQQAIAAAVEQYSPAPVEPVYYAPAPEVFRGIGGRGEYAGDIYDVQPAEEVYVNQGPSAEEIAAAQAEADRAVAQAEADRVAAEQEYFARVEAERVALARAQALEAEAERTQNEAIAARAEQARIAVEQAAAERVAAEQVAAQAQVVEQQAVQTQAFVQAEVAATFAPAAEEVYTSAPQITRGIGGRGEYEDDVYAAQIPETYTPAPAAVYTPPPEPVQVYTPAPEPAPVYTPPQEPVRGIGRRGEYDDDVYAAQVSEVSTPAVEPMTIEAEPVAGIGSPAVSAPAEAPSVIETAVATPAADTGLQVINANEYSPSDADLETMQMSRDQWNEMMASFATMDLGNLNFGNSFGVTNPDATNNFRTFTAPKSNKGNPTSTVAKKDNTFTLIENQPIRLVDQRTGKVVFQGTGYEAAEKAIELAAGLTKEGGNKADWEIQTGQFKNPGSGDLQFGDTFKTVANEKKNTSILNKALDIIGDAALGFIIGGPVGAAIAAGASAAGVNVSDIAYPMIATAVLGPVGFAGTAGAAALGSAVSSAVQGRSIEETLIRAGITGLTAGLMEGTEIGGKISKAVGDTLKSVGVESQTGNIGREIGNLINGTVDKAAGDIIVTAAKKAAEEAVKAAGASAIGGTVSSVVSKAVVDSVQKTIVEEAAKANDIVVTANPVTTAVSGTNPIVETAAGIAGGFADISPPAQPPAQPVEQPVVEQQPKEPIVVNAPKADLTPAPVPEVSGIGGAIPSFDPNAPIDVVATRPVEQPPEETVPEVSGIGGPIAPIVVTAPKVVQPPPEEPVPEVSGIGGAIEPIVVTAPKVVKPPPETVVREEPLPVESVLAGLPLTGLPTPDPALTEEKSTLDKIKDAVNIARAGAAVIPLIAGGGGGGDDGPLVPSGGRYDVNPNRSDIFGTRRPATIGFNPFTYGQATGDQPGEYLFFTRDPVTGAPTIPAPITTPTANEPAGPAMILPSDNTFAEGGEVDDDMAAHLMAYHKNGGHTGPGQVKGIGSGQEDKIPAWLSDGEYVWSAQDVADLGDGSTDEGVRRLDKMRHMVRRRAGRKDVKKIAKPQKGIDHMLKAVGGSV